MVEESPSERDAPKGALWAIAVLLRRHETSITRVSALSIVVSLLVISRRLPWASGVEALSAWVGGLGAAGPWVFGAVYVLAVVLMVPASLLTLAAGALFGLVGGTLTVSIASTTGAALAFLIARYVARDAVARFLSRSPRFAAIDRAIGREGWKIVGLLRLSPLVPFNLQNYLYGLTGIRFWPCVITSWLAMLPGTFLYVSIGHAGRAGIEATLGASAQERGALGWAMLILGVLATLIVTLHLARLTRRAIENEVGLDALIEPDPPGDSGTEPLGWPWRATGWVLLATIAVALTLIVVAEPFRG